jgi:hypothetical protein
VTLYWLTKAAGLKSNTGDNRKTVRTTIIGIDSLIPPIYAPHPI